MAAEALLKPILKWAGGKRQILADILPLIPASPSLYVEPFVGGAAVLLALRPEHARVNDLNAELINVYEVVRDAPDALIDVLRVHEENNSSEYFYEIRGLDREPNYGTLGKVERAARMLYLNKTCYNGLYRVNSSGQINSPYGRYKRPSIVNEPSIRALSEYLKGDIDLRCGDYAEVLKDLPSGAFVYLDPPYMPLSQTSSFTGYTEGGFGYAEQVRLRDECLRLKEEGIHFVESNSDCEAIRKLYDGFDIRSIKAKRAINSKAGGRGAVGEVLICG